MKPIKLKVSAILIFVSVLSFNAQAQLKVRTSGNVILGATYSPLSAKFQVVGNSVFTATNATDFSSAFIRGLNTFSSSTTPDYTWYNNDQTGLFHPDTNIMAFSTGGIERMRIFDNGSVRIGATTTTPATLNLFSDTTGNQMALYLEVNQTVDYAATMVTKCSRALSSNYVVHYNDTDNFYVAGAGWIYSQGSYLGSDRRLKDNIVNLQNATSKLLKLRGVTYNLKSELQNPSVYGQAKKYMGFIAQEVETVVPEVVRENKDGIKSVAYQNLVPLIVEAMKEQNAKINDLENQINSCCNVKNGNGHDKRFINDQKQTGSNDQGFDPLTIPSSDSPINSISRAKLYQNNPNPFNISTTISYYLPKDTRNANLMIFDLQGKSIKTISITTFEESSVKIMANELLSGMYIYSLIADGKEVDSKRMIITE